ncbi:MAG TPA: nuclear transport factor 2 family protein [Candidatus Binatia bacterium]|nr:nuclear transport factor 2 family protein [Candidatus Binatia bacterium]
MGDTTDLERRIRRLEDLEAIKQLKYRYWRCLDLKRWDEMAECFTPDATVDYGGGKYRFTGVDAILRFLRESLGPETGALGYHHGHHPEIEVTGETTATGVWALDNYLFNAARKRGVRIAAYYRDEYVKGGGWRIRHTGYSYVFHEEWSRDDTPSLRLLAP